MKKAVIFLAIFMVLFSGVLFAERHSLGFAGLDVDMSGSNYVVVYYMLQDSPAAGKGGFQMGDIIIEMNGKSTEDLMWRNFPSLLKSDKPTTFTFRVLRDNSPQELEITSVPASSLKGNKAIQANIMELNDNYREVSLIVRANKNRITHKPETVKNKNVYVRVRYAGETWWLYNEVHKMNDDGTLAALSLPMTIDYTRTLYIEMVHQNTNGTWYGDYKYMRGAHAVWGKGYNEAKLYIWHRFERNQLDPVWKEQLSRKVDTKRWCIGLVLRKEGFDYYKNNGYTFPDEITIQGYDSKGKLLGEYTMPVQNVWEKGIWGAYSDLDFSFPAMGQTAEQDLTIRFIVNAEKDGKPHPLNFKVRETVFTTRNNKGMYLNPFSRRLDYYFDEKGQITKLRYR